MNQGPSHNGTTGELEQTSEWPRAGSKVTVVGAGYVGLVTSACLCELGHQVVCVDKHPTRLSTLVHGQVPFFEPGLDELVARFWRGGRLSFTSDYGRALEGSDVVMIAVNTPACENGEAETAHVFGATKEILQHAEPGLVIAVKSTVPVGTGDLLAELAKHSAVPGVEIVSNPEFLRQGSAVNDFMKPDRIVVGGSKRAAMDVVAGLYASLPGTMIFCTRRSAELAKHAANAFLATRISLMNELAAICDAAQADVTEVSQIVGADHRIGPYYLQAGLGWGGSCLPKDVMALAASASSFGCSALILDAVSQVNSRQPDLAIEGLRRAADLQAGSTIGVLGLSFKPDTDDIRGAPALQIIRRLLECGHTIRAHDPQAIEPVRALLPEVGYCLDPYHLAEGCDALFLVTEWREYLALDWTRMLARMRGETILDGRNALDGDILTRTGFTYLSLGRRGRFGSEYQSLVESEAVA